jgi:hypothetical protein
MVFALPGDLIKSSIIKNPALSRQKKTRRPQDIVVTVIWITDCKGRIIFRPAVIRQKSRARYFFLAGAFFAAVFAAGLAAVLAAGFAVVFAAAFFAGALAAAGFAAVFAAGLLAVFDAAPFAAAGFAAVVVVLFAGAFAAVVVFFAAAGLAAGAFAAGFFAAVDFDAVALPFGFAAVVTGGFGFGLVGCFFAGAFAAALAGVAFFAPALLDVLVVAIFFSFYFRNKNYSAKNLTRFLYKKSRFFSLPTAITRKKIC